MQVRKQQLELDREQLTDSKLGKEYNKAVNCHPVYLTYIQSTSCEMSGWMKHKLESRSLGKISITADMQMTPPIWQNVKNGLVPVEKFVYAAHIAYYIVTRTHMQMIGV